MDDLKLGLLFVLMLVNLYAEKFIYDKRFIKLGLFSSGCCFMALVYELHYIKHH